MMSLYLLILYDSAGEEKHELPALFSKSAEEEKGTSNTIRKSTK